MPSCVVIYGASNSGKTHLISGLFNTFSKLSISFDKAISFDFMMSAVCEGIRHYFEGTDFSEEDVRWHLTPFATRNEFNSFNQNLHSILDKNRGYYETIYANKIQGKRSASSFRPGVDSPGDVINLGVLGGELNIVADQIIDLTFTTALVGVNYFLIEGVYFSKETNYSAALSRRCEKIVFLQTVVDQVYKTYSYFYNGERVTSIQGIVERLVIGNFFGPEEIMSNSMKGSKQGIRKYQIFEEGEVGDSPSYQKIGMLHLPDDLTGKSALDIGCNEGYYCFQCEKRGAKAVGIEFNKTWYDLALQRKNELSSKAEFLLMNWNNIHTLNYQFDLVLFLAAFHYLKGTQSEMLGKISKKMNAGGLLIIELGLSSQREGSFFIEEIQRSAGDRCQYPNKFSIEKLLRDAGFSKVTFPGQGFSIKGDPVPRHIVHAYK